MVSKTMNTLVATIECDEVQLTPQSNRPFFRARLRRAGAERLVHQLHRCADDAERDWYLLSWKTPDLRRLSLVRLDRTPRFEQDAHADYLRNELYRVTGRESSCNIDFSASVSAPLLAARLRAASERCDEFIEIIVSILSRKAKSYLLEFVADTDLRLTASAEHTRLARAGESLAAQALASEDFSDWETTDA